MPPFQGQALDDFIDQLLAEDLGSGDVTSNVVLDPEAELSAHMVAREPLVVAGIELAEALFLRQDPGAAVDLLLTEGDQAPAGESLMRIAGNARSLLAGERAALNLVQHLSGIATLTRAYVDAIDGTDAVILDTRKTIPLLRHLEKYATRLGGAKNHRMGLYDAVLIKDNHIAAGGSLKAAVSAALSATLETGMLVEVECDSLEQAAAAIEAGAGRVLLDNMSPNELKEAVRLYKGRVKLEASGGVSLENVREIAETGIDFISVGRITQSAPAVDIGLDYA
jgi:nicotinate-nucleotide pyrophosphorylase (carboxylating)